MRLAAPKTKARRKANPTPADFAALASGLLSAVQIGERLGVMKTTSRKRKTVTRKRRRNPETQAQINARMAKVRAARKSNPGKTTPAKVTPKKVNPRKKVAVPAKGRFYLMTVAKGDDVLGVFINDRDGDGITKKFKSVAAAKAFATKNRLALENPAATPRTVQLTAAFLKRNPWFDFVTREKTGERVQGTVKALTAGSAKRKVRRIVGTKAKVTVRKKTNPRKTASVKAAPTAAKRNAAPSLREWIDLLEAKRKGLAAFKAKYPERAKSAQFRDEWESTNQRLKELRKNVKKRKANPTPKTSKTVATSKTSRTRNPVAKIPRRRTFEMFNGRPATKSRVVPCSKLLGSGARVDQLGKLHEIHMESGEILKLNPAKFNLVAKNGRLWIVGGKFHSGPKVDRKINPWGKIKNIVYSTHKPHHGDRPGQHYIHEMGEWSGNRPTLSLDNEGFPVIQGGSYKIEARGIVD